MRARPRMHMRWAIKFGAALQGSGSRATPEVERVVVEGPGAAGLAGNLHPAAPSSAQGAQLCPSAQHAAAMPCEYTPKEALESSSLWLRLDMLRQCMAASPKHWR